MVSYATRERLAIPLDAPDSAVAHDQIDQALAAGSRIVESAEVCNRTFYPEIVTLLLDWPPDDQASDGYTLWLDEHELISVTTLTDGDGQVVSAADFHLEPRNEGPPYAAIAIDLASGESWDSAAGTWQQAISVLGVKGFDLTTRPAGTLVGAVASTSATSITVSNGAAVGVWDLLLIGTERLEVTGRQLVDTTEDLAATIDEQVSTVLVPTSDGTAFTAGEVITIDAEQMLISQIAGNNLIVRRAVAGSIPADHTNGAPIYASRVLTVRRGALGTTAATHLDGAAIAAKVYPDTVVAATVAHAMTQVLNENAGYARVVGSGEGARQVSAAGVEKAMARARASVGRKGRLF